MNILHAELSQVIQARGVDHLAKYVPSPATRVGYRLDPPDNPPKAVVVNANNNQVIRVLKPEGIHNFHVDVYA